MIHIPGFTFPVVEYLLEDVIEKLRQVFFLNIILDSIWGGGLASCVYAQRLTWHKEELPVFFNRKPSKGGPCTVIKDGTQVPGNVGLRGRTIFLLVW